MRAEVIGVIADELDNSLADRPDPLVYHAFAQAPQRSSSIVVRAESDPGALAASVRAALVAHDPAVPITGPDLLAERVRATIAAPRFATTFAFTLATLAILLSGLGVYGVVAWEVGVRRREIGIRSVLGADARAVAGLVARQAMRTAGVGALLGALSGIIAARLLRTFLFQVDLADPGAFVFAPILLGLVAAVAAIARARRALRIAPAEVLRTD